MFRRQFFVEAYWPEQYVRQCIRCSNFHNWSLLTDGTATCGDCGCVHPPREGWPEKDANNQRPR